ncbi:MAG: asparagine synthase (glutamine-hydrolyzing) [Bacteroidales bacterium]|nr:asparagine synthase (glutamine-hydrolyzing) [Bacteroidales bacterium]
MTSKGHIFKTTSDTEVLVQLYAEYGEACLDKLNGQFAFAIWDKAGKELFIARDRIGIRPLFYYIDNNGLVFGSEIKALLASGKVAAAISSTSLSEVFTFWAPLTPNTVFENIRELQPGHFMKVKQTGEINIKKFWELSFSQVYSKSELPFNRAIDELNGLFHDAIGIRLRADVPVAAYLSGGIDSSLTTAFIKQIEPKVLKTFSIGFAEGEFDETKYQLEASEYLNTEHKAFKCTNLQIAEAFPKVIWHTETPIIRTAPTPMYLLSKMVRENNIKVVITGEGADEMLAGYNIFKENEIRRFWAKYPNSSIRPLLLKKLYPYLPQLQQSNPKMTKFFFGYRLSDTQLAYYSHLLRWNNTSHIHKHFNADVQEKTNGYDPLAGLSSRLPKDIETWGSLAKAQYMESSIFLSGYLLSSQGDRMGMANSNRGTLPVSRLPHYGICSQTAA